MYAVGQHYFAALYIVLAVLIPLFGFHVSIFFRGRHSTVTKLESYMDRKNKLVNDLYELVVQTNTGKIKDNENIIIYREKLKTKKKRCKDIALAFHCAYVLFYGALIMLIFIQGLDGLFGDDRSLQKAVTFFRNILGAIHFNGAGVVVVLVLVAKMAIVIALPFLVPSGIKLYFRVVFDKIYKNVLHHAISDFMRLTIQNRTLLNRLAP